MTRHPVSTDLIDRPRPRLPLLGGNRKWPTEGRSDAIDPYSKWTVGASEHNNDREWALVALELPPSSSLLYG